MEEKRLLHFLLEMFQIERKKVDRSGVYGYTQRLLAFNSNKIEGSTLTEEQTASLFDSGTLPKLDNYYRANGYAIGDYKKRPNMIGIYQTVKPENVSAEIRILLEWYLQQSKELTVLAEFHARYESIHPFQDDDVILRTKLEKPSKNFIFDLKALVLFLNCLKFLEGNGFLL